MGLPCLKGYILKALSEAYGQEKQEYNSRHYLDLAEGALQRCGDVLERSYCQLNATSIIRPKRSKCRLAWRL